MRLAEGLIDCTELSVTGQGGEKKDRSGGGEGDGEGGCILMVSLRNKQLDAGSEWDGLSVEADIK